MNINAIDLFCGVGGLTCGIQKSGINVVAGYDIEKTCKYAYEYNNDSLFINKDVTKLKGEEVNALYPENTDVKVLMGCAPCQPFSTYTFNSQNKKSIKEKVDLLDSFGRLIIEIKPDIVSMENVPQIEKKEVFQRFIKTLKNIGYYVNYKVIYAPDYGVPQSRKRLLLLASLKKEIEFIQYTHTKENYITVRDAIGNLPVIKHGEKDRDDALHSARRLTEINLRRIKQSVPGGTWEDWDDDLKLNCHLKQSGSTYRSVYGRMEWDKPSPTITTQFYGFGNGRFGHPEQDRALTHREAALLQTFPSRYSFFNEEQEVFKSREIGIQIGNAVPPKLGEIIGLSIRKHLGENSYE